MKWALTRIRGAARVRAAILLLILALAFIVRALTAQFMAAHLNDPAWFQPGSYKIFDARARSILNGEESPFWINNPTRMDQAIYPPGFPIWVAFIYGVSGEQSSAVVHRVHWVLDVLAVWLIVGIGVSAYGWRVGLAAGVLAALSPLLAIYGAWPSSDAPTSWLVLGSVWIFLLAAKRRSITLAFGAGVMLGIACWLRVNPALLAFAWALALLLFVPAPWRRKAGLSAAVVCGTVLVVAPITIRNTIAFGTFMPTGLGVGTNLWEGIGETERAAEFGAVYGDALLIEQERTALGVAPDAPFDLYYPNGVERDRERARQAMAVITAHPVWYAGVMLRRMWGMLKFAGEPLPYYGTAGINCTSQKCLPPRWQGGVLAVLVNVLGMVQSVMRWVALPLMVYGVWVAWRLDWRITGLILATVLYYLVTSSAAHTEIRYVLPMQALLFLFAGIAVCRLGEAAYTAASRRRMRRHEIEWQGQ